MSLSGVSISDSSSTGAGAALVFDTPKANVSMQLTFTGAGGTVDLEGSLDGVTFYAIASASLGSDGEIVSSSGKPVVAARANITALSGATGVSATIAAA